MTLTNAIAAARIISNDLKNTVAHNVGTAVNLRNALAALPDKPMTEDEIKEIILRNLYLGEYGIFRALKAADCLYVKED